MTIQTALYLDSWGIVNNKVVDLKGYLLHATYLLWKQYCPILNSSRNKVVDLKGYLLHATYLLWNNIVQF